ncbi:MAG: Fpg/Nei family DNA glycosylase [Candidatus Bathyarchaeota archaeon]|nr:Fpg/Nei family DNA glycosylase [Candidatus Bathyarchaeota archaeon]
MPELPEITVIARQMHKETAGKRIADIEARQPKNLNISVQEFVKTAKGKRVNNVSSKGKWIFIKLDPAYYLLINRGMNADLLYFTPNQTLPEKYQFKLTFNDKTGFTIQFQWFGYIHLVPEKNLNKHKLTAQLGISPVDKGFTLGHFKELLTNKKGGIKSFLIDQKNVAGIGNVYIQDILFKAKLHPNRKISTLSEKEINNLYNAIGEILNRSIQLGGLAYEKDFYGQKGKLTINEFLVGYRTGKPCLTCKTPIEKIKTGSTASYICPKCQPLK